MLIHIKHLISGSIELEPEDDRCIYKTIDIIETLDDIATKNNSNFFDFLDNHYENFVDFLYDLAEDSEATFKLLLKDINE